MILSDVSVRRPIFATMMTAAMVVFGAISYNRLGVDLFPDVDFPIVTVTTVLEGADPETVETTITEVVEEAVNTISGIKTLRSESTEGVSTVIVEFELERDIDIAAQDVRDKVAIIRSDLPPEIDPPVVEKFDLDSAPILTIALAGEGYNIRQLTDYADDVLKERIQRLQGVGAVKIVGGREMEVRIWVDPAKLEARFLTINDIMKALRDQNVKIPGGRVETGEREFVVKTEAEAEQIPEFEDFVLAHRNGAAILLKDVATVEEGLEDQRTYASLNGTLAVALHVRRQSGTNLVAIADRVKEEYEKALPGLPPGMTLSIAQDASTFVRHSIEQVQHELLFGGMLAVIIIFFFLRNWRSTAVVAVVLPTSVVATFSLMNIAGFTFNNLTMLALALSVGILVDDAIIMVENIFRHIELGQDRLEATFLGSREISFAVIAASASLVAVFIPVAFMQGLVGRFFLEFGLTMTFIIVISTFITLTLTPMLCSKWLKKEVRHSAVFSWLEVVFLALETGYRTILGVSLKHPRIVVLVAFVAFVASLLLVPGIGKEFAPEEDESEFLVKVETPTGYSIEKTISFLQDLEGRIKRFPGVTDIFTTIGGGAQEKINEGEIRVLLVNKGERDFSQTELMDALRGFISGIPDTVISLSRIPRVSGGGQRSQTIQFNLRGPSLEELESYSGKILSELRKSPGIVDLDTTFESGKPEAQVYIDRQKAADMGVDIRELATVIQSLIGGADATKYERAGDQYDVRVRAYGSYRDRPEKLGALVVRADSGRLVRLDNCTTVLTALGPTQIDHQSRQRQITILANLQGIPLGQAVDTINKTVTDMNLPSEYQTGFTGFADLMMEAFTNILFALFLSVIMVYMILASQFESYSHPFTVMLTVPLAVAGALATLYVTGKTLNIYSMIGFIVLVGIVTKNAILLIDLTNQLRRDHGMPSQKALLEACPQRLRPILMTALATIAGALPIILAFGAGAESRAPMAIAISGGLFFSTALTLLVIPAVYLLISRDASSREEI